MSIQVRFQRSDHTIGIIGGDNSSSGVVVLPIILHCGLNNLQCFLSLVFGIQVPSLLFLFLLLRTIPGHLDVGKFIVWV